MTSTSPQQAFAFDASKFSPEFAEWLAANTHIWTRFCGEAHCIWNSGRRHWSARTIIEYLRHETALTEVGGEFKINNNYAPDMARLFADTFPDRASLFSTRHMPGSARAA